jgi:excinuclease UvrABC ATPase subunit
MRSLDVRYRCFAHLMPIDDVARSRPFAEMIRVRGARVNNLTGFDVDIPKRQLVVFTGVSGSGKSSLAFDTIAAESQRLLNETYPAFVQNLLPKLRRPDVDQIEHLSAAIVVNQAPMGANPRSTVGTATDAVGRLRALFATHGAPVVAGPRALSFNDPAGTCPDCDGSGEQASLDVGQIIDGRRSLNEGAITFPNFAVDSLFWKVYARSGYFDNDLPIDHYTPESRAMLLTGSGPSINTGTHPMAYEGVLAKIRRLYVSKGADALKPRLREALQQCATVEACAACEGSRLNAAARECRIAGMSIADVSSLQASELAAWVTDLDLPATATPLRDQLISITKSMHQVGLGYLSLDRPTGTLSGGEAQRIRTVLHVDSALTELTYVFDEPAAGLHPHDTARVVELLHQLRDKGNSVLVVEHQRDVIEAADYIIDIGPLAGAGGGRVVFEGSPTQLATADTLTARHLRARPELRADLRMATGTLTVRHANTNNLRDLTVEIPLGCLVTITGVAGAGKTSLLSCLPRRDDLAVLDQTPIRGSRRSSPATYTGILDDLRDQFALANNVKANLFSPNSAGACEDCRGLGVIVATTALGETTTSICATCDGRRFNNDVLHYTLHGHDIVAYLDMPIEQALTVLADSASAPILGRLHAVGLGYVRLGQPLSSLSGGERQRLRLAIEIGRDADIYALDEPTNGLHLADVHNLIRLFDELIDTGASVIVAEHHRDLIARSDWIIDLGPDAGHDGGTVVFEGTPAQLAEAPTHTGRAFRSAMNAHHDTTSPKRKATRT